MNCILRIQTLAIWLRYCWSLIRATLMNVFWNALLSYSCRTLVLLNLVDVTACSFECVRHQTADTRKHFVRTRETYK